MVCLCVCRIETMVSIETAFHHYQLINSMQDLRKIELHMSRFIKFSNHVIEHRAIQGEVRFVVLFRVLIVTFV